MEPGLIWILLGALLLGGELLLPGVFLLWIGLAAVATGLAVWMTAPSFAFTVLIFVIALAGFVALGLRYRPRPRGHPAINSPISGLVGRSGTVIFADATGLRVRVGDSDWPARLPRDVEQAGAGVAVRVEAVDGTVLVVRPVSS